MINHLEVSVLKGKRNRCCRWCALQMPGASAPGDKDINSPGTIDELGCSLMPWGFSSSSGVLSLRGQAVRALGGGVLEVLGKARCKARPGLLGVS